MHATRHAVVSAALLLLLLLLVLISIVTLVPSTPPSSFFRPRPIGGGGCDYSDGKWVRDDGDGDGGVAEKALYGEDCPFLDPGFQCLLNGRRDSSFRSWRWQPRGCRLPMFNATEMLERSRNGRIVFAGDSIGRNQWESMVCMLAAGAGKSRIYEQSGKPLSRHKGYLSMVFAAYNLSVEYYRAPMLVMVDRFNQTGSSNGTAGGAARGAVRLDALPRHADRWAGADVLVLNTGHWWNLHKTIESGNYFMVGDRLNVTTDVKEAFRRSLQTVADWELSSARRSESYLFFRSFSPSHYSNGTWDTGGSCADDRDPLPASTSDGASGGGGFSSEEYSWINAMIAGAAREVRRRGKKAAVYLDITHMTELRRDGHPSRHRELGTPADAPEDCSHWCLPGVPDVWNEVLYAHLLAMGYDKRAKLR